MEENRLTSEQLLGGTGVGRSGCGFAVVACVCQQESALWAVAPTATAAEVIQLFKEESANIFCESNKQNKIAETLSTVPNTLSGGKRGYSQDHKQTNTQTHT